MPQHWFSKEVVAERNPILECHLKKKKKKFKEIEVHLFALEFKQEQQKIFCYKTVLICHYYFRKK